MMNSRNSSASQRPSSGKVEKNLLSREEEYKRMNEELEAKTASLIKDAEQVIKEQESLLSKPSLLDNINTEDFLDDFGNDEISAITRDESQDSSRSRDVPPSATGSRAASRVSATSKLSNTQRAASIHSRPPSQGSKSAKGSRSKSRGARAADDVAVPDEAFLTQLSELSTIQHAISDIESRAGEMGASEELDDVLPSAAQDLGAEAQIRFLKAKLRVMQEELDRLAHECNKKDEENTSLSAKLKEVEEDRARLTRTASTQQQNIDKYKRLADDAKGKADSLDTQLHAVKKELDGVKRSQKQQASSQSATEVRLNRALEELDKYKSQLQRAKSSSKETSDQEKRKVENLLSENRRLEKQKNELMTGFKKQLKLIDILKRQKMHIEAAKMLQFSEEEFVKALEWGS